VIKFLYLVCIRGPHWWIRVLSCSGAWMAFWNVESNIFDEVFIVLSGGHLFLVTRVTCMLHDILILYSLFRFQSRSFTRWVLASIGYRCLNVLEIAGFLCTWSCFRLIHIICWSNSCRDITFLSFHLLSSPSLIQNRTTS